MIQTLVEECIALLVFSVLAKPKIRSDRNLVCTLISPRGTYVQSFRWIAPAVTKRALLTDDGQHVIVRAHTWAKKYIFFFLIWAHCQFRYERRSHSAIERPGKVWMTIFKGWTMGPKLLWQSMSHFARNVIWMWKDAVQCTLISFSHPYFNSWPAHGHKNSPCSVHVPCAKFVRG
jgi:hypothetical protein